MTGDATRAAVAECSPTSGQLEVQSLEEEEEEEDRAAAQPLHTHLLRSKQRRTSPSIYF